MPARCRLLRLQTTRTRRPGQPRPAAAAAAGRSRGRGGAASRRRAAARRAPRAPLEAAGAGVRAPAAVGAQRRCRRHLAPMLPWRSSRHGPSARQARARVTGTGRQTRYEWATGQRAARLFAVGRTPRSSTRNPHYLPHHTTRTHPFPSPPLLTISICMTSSMVGRAAGLLASRRLMRSHRSEEYLRVCGGGAAGLRWRREVQRWWWWWWQ